MTPEMYRPGKKYLTKILLEMMLIGFFVATTAGWLGSLIAKAELSPSMSTIGLFVGLTINLVWIIPSIVLINRYYQSLHYEIHEDEVIMHVGVITKTVKHVPIRTITNLKVKRGPFDRLFNLGTIDIQTAGRSGENGAEESLVGLSDVREVYNKITSKLRMVRTRNATSGDDDNGFPEGYFLAEMIELLQQIRTLLDNKL